LDLPEGEQQLKVTQNRRVVFQDRTLTYELTRKKVKNINLRIKPPGLVCVSASTRVPLGELDDFVRSNEAFICKHLERFAQNKKTLPEERAYETGEIFYLMGKVLRLKVETAMKDAVFGEGAELILQVKDPTNLMRKAKLIEDWYKTRQLETFTRISQEVYGQVRLPGVVFPQLKVRKMTSRWGSCHPRKGIITLNSKLIEAPRTCIEYVIFHEFIHFVHPNHSKDFYHLLAQFLPDWKSHKRELENWI
jgi:predicted metal-dependent hydrolase